MTEYHTVRTGGCLTSLEKPVVMGILNITPDSFYDGGRYTDAGAVRDQAARMLAEGAVILDVGACSSRPGSTGPDESEEQRRLELALGAIRRECPDCAISLDTYRSGIARWAVAKYNIQVINDISGGTMDPGMDEAVADLGIPYVLMHIHGTPETMQIDPDYLDPVADILGFFSRRVSELTSLGVADIILDPGFGFGKTLEHNYQILARLGEFSILGRPLLAGISRKSMVYRVLETDPEGSLNGTTALHMAALAGGARILRVHDVAEAVQCIRLFEKVSLNDR